MSKEIKLTPEQVRDLTQSHHDMSAVLTECDKAENCGIDCQALRDGVTVTMAQIDALMENYGPKRK